MLFNEPKLLKFLLTILTRAREVSFSALQRAEIAEMKRPSVSLTLTVVCFSALQRAEIAEIVDRNYGIGETNRFQCSSTSRNC